LLLLAAVVVVAIKVALMHSLAVEVQVVLEQHQGLLLVQVLQLL
jgi:hypothetical protein